MSDELTNLRVEIERLLANAVRDDARHLADVDRRDALHIHELERRDELQLAEVMARDEVHLHELQVRADLHAHEVETIRQALESRDLIGQAKGVMIASMGCTAEEAFRLIVKQSQHENRKATDIAAEVVQRVTRRPRRPARPSDPPN